MKLNPLPVYVSQDVVLMAISHPYVRREVSDLTASCCNTSLLSVTKPFPTTDDAGPDITGKDGDGDDDDELPIWAIAVIVLCGIMLIIIIILIVFIVLMKTK